MASLEQRFKDPEYRNWVKTALCLNYVRDGLVGFAEVKSQELQQKVIRQLQLYGNPSVNGLCQTIGFNVKKMSITCCTNCNGILTELQRYRTGNQPLNLMNADPRMLISEHWQMAKLYMNSGQDTTNKDPNHTDVSGLLNFIEKCSVPAQCLSVPGNIKQVRTTRNQIIHSHNMKVTDADFKNIILVMVNLLEDPGYLLNDQQAIDAVKSIKEIAHSDVIITRDNETEVFKELINIFRRQTELISSEIDNIRKETLKSDSHTQESIDQIQEKIKENEGEMEKVQIELEILRNATEKYEELQESLPCNISTIEEVLKTIKGGHAELRKMVDKINVEILSVRKDVSYVSSCVKKLEKGHRNLEKQQEAVIVQQSISGDWINTAKKKFESVEEHLKEHDEQHKETRQHLKEHDEQHKETKHQVHGLMRQMEDIKSRVNTETEYLKQGVQELKSCPTEEDKVKLVHYLKEGYRDKLNVPMVPGCLQIPVSEIFAPVILINDNFQKSQKRDEKRTIDSYANMFYQEGVLQKRLFLLGEAGEGKTTFCKHLTDTWCNEAIMPQFEDTDVLKRFKFVFYVLCRFAEDTETILGMICNQLFDDEFMKSVAAYCLKNFPDICLILADGLDEWKGCTSEWTGRRGDIPGLPSFLGVDQCAILITSRPWKIHELLTSTNSICRWFELCGLKEVEKLTEDILTKLEHPCPKQSSAEFLVQIKRYNMADIIQTPLILISALNIWSKNKTLHKSVCMNYISMIDSFISRAMGVEGWTKAEGRLNQSLKVKLPDLISKWEKSADSLPNCCRSHRSLVSVAGLLLQLSHLAFDQNFRITTLPKLVFSEDVCKIYLSANDLEISLAIGLLSQSQAIRGIMKVKYFSFCHKSIQEFLAALHPSSSSLAIAETIQGWYEGRGVLKFICGLRPNTGKQVLENLGSCKKEYLVDYRYQGVNEFQVKYSQKLVLDCTREAHLCCLQKTSEGQCFFLPDLIVEKYTTKEELVLLERVLEEYSADVKSLAVRNIERFPGECKNFLMSLQDCSGLQMLKLVNVTADYINLDLRKCVALESLELSDIKLDGFLLPRYTLSSAIGVLLLSHQGLEKLIKSISSSCKNDMEITFEKKDSTYFSFKITRHNRDYLIECSCSDHGNSCLPMFDVQGCSPFVSVILNEITIDRISLPSPVGQSIKTLIVRNTSLKHHGLQSLWELLACSYSVRKLQLFQLSCIDHGGRECCEVVNLREIRIRESLMLFNLPVRTVLLSLNNCICLRELCLSCVSLDYADFDQLCRSFDSHLYLEKLTIIDIRCERTASNGFVLDVRQNIRLDTLNLANLAVNVVLLPVPDESNLRILILSNLALNESALSDLFQSLSSQRAMQKLILESISTRNSKHTTLDLANLQTLEKLCLQNLSVDSFVFRKNALPMLVDLSLIQLSTNHKDVQKLCVEIFGCRTLVNLEIIKMCCTDHPHRTDCLHTLNIPDTHILQELRLKALCVERLRLPMDTFINLLSVDFTAVTISHDDFHLLVQMVFSRTDMREIICEIETTRLSIFTRSDVVTNVFRISCAEHGLDCCSLAFNLQHHNQLDKLQLNNLSVETLQLPDDPNTDTFTLTLQHVQMSVKNWESLMNSLCPPPCGLQVKLRSCNMDEQTKSGFKSFPHFIITKDNEDEFEFESW